MIFINTKRDRNNKDSALNKLSGKKPTKPAQQNNQASGSNSTRSSMQAAVKNRDTEIDLMIKERLAFMDRVNNERHMSDERIDARNNLKSYCYNLVETIEDGNLPKEDSKALMTACTESLEWVLTNENASKVEFENRLRQMIDICEPLKKESRTMSRADSRM